MPYDRTARDDPDHADPASLDAHDCSADEWLTRFRDLADRVADGRRTAG